MKISCLFMLYNESLSSMRWLTTGILQLEAGRAGSHGPFSKIRFQGANKLASFFFCPNPRIMVSEGYPDCVHTIF